MNRSRVERFCSVVHGGLARTMPSEAHYAEEMSALATLRILAIEAVSGPPWQPIETAPKAPSGVLLWFPPLPERGLVGVGTPGYYSYVRDRWLPEGHDVRQLRRGQQPTHWMRLLEGPCTPSK